MQIERHSLTMEFPEFKETIQALKQSNAHFGKLLEDYNNTDAAIRRNENGLEHLGDIALENLKKVRISLKDQLFELMRAAQQAA